MYSVCLTADLSHLVRQCIVVGQLDVILCPHFCEAVGFSLVKGEEVSSPAPCRLRGVDGMSPLFHSAKVTSPLGNRVPCEVSVDFVSLIYIVCHFYFGQLCVYMYVFSIFARISTCMKPPPVAGCSNRETVVKIRGSLLSAYAK